MTERHHRHLPPAGGGASPAGLAAAEATSGLPTSPPPGMTWRDHLILLLHLGAEIEHALMVEYLYAAYSLGGDQVPATHRDEVRRWQQQILTVAQEEMGHLITIQNLLTLLGAPVSFERQDYPWDSPFYPFQFKLAPLTMHTLSHYVYAESPPPQDVQRGGMSRDEQRIYDEVQERVHRERGIHHRVGEIYDPIVELLSRSDLIPASDFLAETYAYQASWDEWGKGYQSDPGRPDPDPDPAVAEGSPPPKPLVIVGQMATRKEALDTLKLVAGQGEAPHLKTDETEEPSHFERFAHVYKGFERIKGWTPVRAVPTNPTTLEGVRGKGDWTYIENDTSRSWADLFNLRYRMLLTYLSHSYRLQRTPSDGVGVRARTLHRVFGEMYNLKTLAGILVRKPLGDPRRAPRAGPPFQMPYTLDLPTEEADCWRLHQDLLCSSTALCGKLASEDSGDSAGVTYLESLMHLDRQSHQWANQVLVGLGADTRRCT